MKPKVKFLTLREKKPGAFVSMKYECFELKYKYNSPL